LRFKEEAKHLILSVYKQFSENLITLCARQGSIAAVCRGTGINRQQFSRYLSGTSLPNEETLEKISAFFKIPQTALFQSGLQEGDKRSDFRKALAAIPDLPPELKDICTTIIEKGGNLSLNSGVYAVYAPSSLLDGKVIRGALSIASKKGVAAFSMIMPADWQLGGRIDGIALQEKLRISLIGHWQDWARAMFALYLNADNSVNQKAWHGVALSFLPTGAPIASKVIVEHVGPASALRETIENSGVVTLDDDRLTPTIKASVMDLSNDKAATLISSDALKAWRT
jgi:transcriptional regulator with XRE-family HTH domain